MPIHSPPGSKPVTLPVQLSVLQEQVEELDQSQITVAMNDGQRLDPTVNAAGSFLWHHGKRSPHPPSTLIPADSVLLL
jgi:hypothetical protein